MKTKIAPGHNPDKLTVEQVGKGWRLLTLREIRNRVASQHIQAWVKLPRRWFDEFTWAGNSRNITYRTRKPKGYWLTH